LVERTKLENPIRIGVLSDTHIPDRVGDFHPDVLPTIQKLNVDLIIHAGDISIPDVLQRLEQIAPVHAVRGNRDWWQIRNLPTFKEITLKEVKILITHGYGNLFSYLWDKIPNWLFGYRYEHFVKKFSKLGQNFDIIIFGHSHRPENRWKDGRLYFNPGSAYDPSQKQLGPSIGLIEIGEGKFIKSEIIYLTAMKWVKNHWTRDK